MAEGKKGFVLYADIIHTVRKLPKNKCADLFMTILEYVNDENPNVTDKMVDLVFEPIKRQLKRDLIKFESIKQKRKEAGKAGGIKSGQVRSKQANEASASSVKQTEANEAVIVTVNEIVTVNDNDTDNESESKSTPLTGYGIKNYDITYEIRKDDEWVTAMVLKYNIPGEELAKELDKFCDYLFEQGEIRKTVKDFKSHYVNLKNKRPDFLNNGKEIDWDKI